MGLEKSAVVEPTWIEPHSEAGLSAGQLEADSCLDQLIVNDPFTADELLVTPPPDKETELGNSAQLIVAAPQERSLCASALFAPDENRAINSSKIIFFIYILKIKPSLLW